MTNCLIKIFQREEAEALLELNLIEQGKWFHGSPDGQLTKEPASWEELTPYERWLHGGWWLDPDTLALYLDVIEETQGVILVAEKNGKFIGELDLAIGYDPIFKETRAHLLWLVVHPKHRRKGVAKRLVQAAATVARKRGAQALYTEAEDNRSERLYVQSGFTKATTITEKVVYPTEINYEEVENLEFESEKVDSRQIPVNSYLRILGSYYTPEWDVVRASRLGQLYDILGVPIPEPSFVKTILDDFTAYMVLDHRPRIFVESLDVESIHIMTKIAVTESYYEANGPDLYLQYYEQFSESLGLSERFQIKQKGTPLFRKPI